MRKFTSTRRAFVAALVVATAALVLIPLVALASTDCFNYDGRTRTCSMNINCTQVNTDPSTYCKQICTGYGYPDPGCCSYTKFHGYYANSQFGDCPCAGWQYDVIVTNPPGGTDPLKTCYFGGSPAPCQTETLYGTCQ